MKTKMTTNATNNRVGIMLTSMFFGLMSAASASYAQETAQKSRHVAEPVGQKPAGIAEYEMLLDEADALVKNGKPEDAYNLLEPLEFIHSGEARFDYLIGIAALDSGKPDKATLAFERALTVNSEFSAARLEMARAYYQLGDILRAKTEFTRVLKQNTSASVNLTIQKYLEAIAEQESGKLTHVAGYVEVTAGYDSNVNNSNSQSQIIVGGTNITLDPTNVKASDDYYGVAAGGVITRNLIPNWRLYAGADVRQRDYCIQKSFDALSLDERAGVMFDGKSDRLSVGILGGQYTLGYARNSDSVGAIAEWNHVFSPANQLKIFGQYVQYRYIDPDMQPNDFNQQALGGGWTHVLSDGKSLLSGSLYHGKENDVSTMITAATPNGGRADGPSQFNGLRVTGQTAIGDKTKLFATAGMQAEDYDNVNTYFLVKRSDRLYDLAVGANWQWNKSWSLRPQLNYSKNDSNIVIYTFSRIDVSVNIRREFR
jgi:tetratricopeptide (TPR) repeat protein